MKKVLALVLAAVLIMGLAVPAAANGTLDASVSTVLPALANETGNVKLLNRDDILKSPEEIQNIMEESNKELVNADTKGLGLRYFFYSEIASGESTVSVEFESIPNTEILFMQYIDGLWVQLEHSVGDDGIITVSEIIDAPFAIFMDGKDSPGASWTELIPILTDESNLIVQLHNLEEIVTMSEEIQNRMAEAKDKLKDACPADFAVKYFFELEILGAEGPVSVDFEPIEHSEIVFKQFVDGTWVELESSMNDGGIITVSGIVNGPVATFVK